MRETPDCCENASSADFRSPAGTEKLAAAATVVVIVAIAVPARRYLPRLDVFINPPVSAFSAEVVLTNA